MIDIRNISSEEPYTIFRNYYKKAIDSNQKCIEGVCISSMNTELNEVESRMVNLKYIIDDEWIFFSNYNSLKAQNFSNHDQISALFYWDSINVQIRIKAKIFKTLSKFSDAHFEKRSIEKNALSISSMQSQPIDSYKKVIKNYKNTLNNKSQDYTRPSYWGGYSFKPYYCEFWEGHESRVNKREVFIMDDKNWKYYIIQP